MANASAHNGGLSQVNFYFLQIGGDYPFLNQLKAGQSWTLADNSGFPTPDTLDSDGYPSTITNGGVFSIFYVPSQTARPGSYAVTWDGNGTIRCNMSNTVLPTATFTGSVTSNVLTAGAPSGGTIKKGMTLSVGGTIGDQITGSTGAAGTYTVVGGSNAGSQSMTVSGGSKTTASGSGRYVFSTVDTRFDVGISSIGSPKITNMKVFHVDDEAAILAGDIFGVKFKQRLAEANFGVYRFLDWQNANTTNITTWATRKPTTYVYYSGGEHRSALYAGTASVDATSRVYTVSAPSTWPGLVDKAMIHTRFSAVASFSATFTSGQANIAATAHGRSVNDRLVLHLGTMPTGFSADTVYFVVSVPDANNFQLSATPGGGAITPSSTSTVTIFPHDASIPSTFTSGQQNISAPLHGRSVNERVVIGTPGGSIPGGYVYNTVYYVVSVPDANTLTLSATQGGAAITASTTTNARINPIITLNVGSTGAADLLIPTGDYVTGSSNPDSSYYPIAGRTATLVYDALLGKWIKHGGDGVNGNTGISNNVPIEMMVQLCAEMGAHPWFCAPYLACTPMTDWFTQLGTYCKNNGPAWMIPRFEGVNELWNTALGFYGTNYANTIGAAYGWGAGDYQNWQGRVISTIGQDISAVYADDRSKYRVICGVQTFGSTSGSNPRLASTKYLLQTPQSGYTASAASGWVTDICLANYFHGSTYGTGTESTLAAAYAGGDLTAPRTFEAAVIGAGTFTLDSINTLFSSWKTWAQGFGINRMCCYEGGYDPVYGAGSTIDSLRAASKDAPDLLYHTMLGFRNFTGKSGGGFTADFPSCYVMAGNPTVSGNGRASAWSVLEDIYIATDPPQWTAIKLFNARKRRMKIKIV